MLIRCSACLGKKQVIKLGMMEGDCDICKGIGHIHQKDEVIKESRGAGISDDNPYDVKITPLVADNKKTRSRKPRQMAING